ncbi:MAG: flagellar assembly protein H, partial [Candidatus Solibacter usitatus]|nr:flagellar assembly protein H [Candidatus Solibacter usitatus]
SSDAFFLIHVEHQSTAPATFPRRFFSYFSALTEKRGLPVYPIVIYSHDEPKKAQPNSYRLDFPDGEVLRFTYRVVQLNRLSWRRFVNRPNPVASALMAKMKIADRDRPRVKVECLLLMLTLKLDRARMRLIASFVDAHLRLNETEDMRFRSIAEEKLPPEQKEEIVEYVTSWELKGIEKGRVEGRQEVLGALRAVLLDILAARFGPPDEPVTSRVAGIDSVDELRTLTRRALAATSLQEVGV